MDDTQLYLCFPSDSKDAVLGLDQCLLSLRDRMKANKLERNPDKIEVLLVSQKAKIGE